MHFSKAFIRSIEHTETIIEMQFTIMCIKPQGDF